MSALGALGTIAKVLSNPTVRAIVLPLAEEVARWVRGGEKPKWIDSVREVPGLKSRFELLEARERRRARR